MARTNHLTTKITFFKMKGIHLQSCVKSVDGVDCFKFFHHDTNYQNMFCELCGYLKGKLYPPPQLKKDSNLMLILSINFAPLWVARCRKHLDRFRFYCVWSVRHKNNVIICVAVAVWMGAYHYGVNAALCWSQLEIAPYYTIIRFFLINYFIFCCNVE